MAADANSIAGVARNRKEVYNLGTFLAIVWRVRTPVWEQLR
jgi:hypothetical protein